MKYSVARYSYVDRREYPASALKNAPSLFRCALGDLPWRLLLSSGVDHVSGSVSRRVGRHYSVCGAGRRLPATIYPPCCTSHRSAFRQAAYFSGNYGVPPDASPGRTQFPPPGTRWGNVPADSPSNVWVDVLPVVAFGCKQPGSPWYDETPQT